MSPGASLILRDQLRGSGPVRSPLWASEPLLENLNGAGIKDSVRSLWQVLPAEQGTRDTQYALGSQV